MCNRLVLEQWGTEPGQNRCHSRGALATWLTGHNTHPETRQIISNDDRQRIITGNPVQHQHADPTAAAPDANDPPVRSVLGFDQWGSNRQYRISFGIRGKNDPPVPYGPHPNVFTVYGPTPCGRMTYMFVMYRCDLDTMRTALAMGGEDGELEWQDGEASASSRQNLPNGRRQGVPNTDHVTDRMSRALIEYDADDNRVRLDLFHLTAPPLAGALYRADYAGKLEGN